MISNKIKELQKLYSWNQFYQDRKMKAEMKKKTDFSTTSGEVMLYFILCAVVSILWAYITN